MRLSHWLRPAIIGPCLSVTALVTIGVLLGWTDKALGGAFVNWLYGMGIGGIIALLCAGSLLGVDLMYDRANLRKKPVGVRAWTMSIAMPFAVVGVYQALSPSDGFGPAFMAAVVLPVIGVAAIVRYVFGET